MALGSKRTLAIAPYSRLEQANSAFEAMSSMQAQQQHETTPAAAATGTDYSLQCTACHIDRVICCCSSGCFVPNL